MVKRRQPTPTVDMDHHIKEFYRCSPDESPSGNFHAVISLHEAPDVRWEEISAKTPLLPRGWYELAHLDSKDRVEFTRDFWMMKIPYRERLTPFIDRFFSSVDDICVFLTQKKFSDPFEAHLVYSLRGNTGFYQGLPPITEKNQAALQAAFPKYLLPPDYLAFLQIHDGFSKTTDCTGLTHSLGVIELYQIFQEFLAEKDPLLTSQGVPVNPETLIPFYESFGMPFYQCFWAEWYPEQEMGNVYYSGEAHTISDVFCGASSAETMAFATFTEWLMFYLERVV